MSRGAVIELVLTALTTPGKPSTQRALARTLGAVSVETADLAGRLPLVQGLIATCHGSVGAVLLPTALALCETLDDVVELCTTIAGRPERRQKADLLKELARRETTARLGLSAVLAGLGLLAQGADAAWQTAWPLLVPAWRRATRRLAPCRRRRPSVCGGARCRASSGSPGTSSAS